MHSKIKFGKVFAHQEVGGEAKIALKNFSVSGMLIVTESVTEWLAIFKEELKPARFTSRRLRSGILKPVYSIRPGW